MFLIVLILIFIVLNVHTVLYIFCKRIHVSASEPWCCIISVHFMSIDWLSYLHRRTLIIKFNSIQFSSIAFHYIVTELFYNPFTGFRQRKEQIVNFPRVTKFAKLLEQSSVLSTQLQHFTHSQREQEVHVTLEVSVWQQLQYKYSRKPVDVQLLNTVTRFKSRF